jgi:hypothetical protein
MGIKKRDYTLMTFPILVNDIKIFMIPCYLINQD